MSTKSEHRTFECVRSEMPQKKLIPPWCYSRKPCGRKPRRSEYKERYPLREYLEKNKKCECSRKAKSRKGTIFIVCFFAAVGFMALWMSNKLPPTDLITKVITNTKFATLLNMNQSAQSACYDRTKHLIMEYSRMQKHVRSFMRVRRTTLLASISRDEPSHGISYRYVKGATATKGRQTEEWHARLALWGVVPLWRASPPISTVLALRKPVPSDCWPFIGNYGEIIIHLSRTRKITGVSIEHIRPDTARSAPKDFVLYGVLLNDTEVKLMANQYQSAGPAKQYYRVNTQAPFKSILLRILSNQGNSKYTCVYRVHVYGEKSI